MPSRSSTPADEPNERRFSAHEVVQFAMDDLLRGTPAEKWLREDHVARRITQEREARGWSQERLAREMKRHGFALAQSSISKIEKPAYGTSRRAITVDDAIGLAVVFEMPLLKLLAPVGPYEAQAVQDLADGADLAEAAENAETAYRDAVTRVATEYVNHGETFGPILAGEARRLCEAAGIEYESGLNAALLRADPGVLEPPARYRLMFVQAALRVADQLKPKRGRGPRKART